MKMPLELRYAVLISLGTLLWLALEAVVGFHDRYIDYYPVASILSLGIPIVFGYVAVREKKAMQAGAINFRQALITGLIIAVLTAVFVVPVQLVFHYWINPYFLDDMVAHDMASGKVSAGQAAMYFNLTSYIIRNVLGTLAFGSVVAIVVALFVRTKK